MPNVLTPRRTGLPVSIQRAQLGKPRLVIVGGGLGGVALAKRLSRHRELSITLIDVNDRYIFKPRLHEWLCGEESSVPMTTLFPMGSAIRFIQARAERISMTPENKVVYTTQGELPYDYLVIATGAKTAYFKTPGAGIMTLPLEKLNDIRVIKQRVLRKLARAAIAKPLSEVVANNLSFEVIGGGATGIELAFELKFFIKKMIRERFAALQDCDPLIQVLEGSSGILPGFSAHERELVLGRIQKEDIVLLLNHRVVCVEDRRLLITKTDDTHQDSMDIAIPSIDPIWVAGVEANTPCEMLNGERLPRDQRIKVNQHLELLGHPEVYVIGDTAAFISPRDGQPLPPLGQVAEQEAGYVAADILRKVQGNMGQRQPFEFHSRGRFLALGPKDAIISLGFLPWPLNRLVLSGWIANKVRDLYFRYNLRI